LRVRPIYTVSKTLIVSQLRSTRTGYRKTSLIRRPIILLVVDIACFVIPALIAYATLSLVQSSTFSQPVIKIISTSLPQYLASLPSFTTSAVFVIGLILELSQTSQFSSTDTVNWLPITSVEYVSASNFAMVAIYSFLPLLALGALFPFAYYFDLMAEWVLAALLSFFGMFLASSLLEILRAVLNRVSSSFYKRGGRRVIASRLIIGIVSIVFLNLVIQLALNPNFSRILLGPITTAFSTDWFVPFFWSSIAISQLSAGNLPYTTTFAVGSLGLTFGLFYLAVVVRRRYWVPLPVAIRVTTREYTPQVGIWRYMGLSSVQTAIAKKDLRSMVRRRETQRLLAIPAIILIITLIGGFRGIRSAPPTSFSDGFTFLFSLFPSLIAVFFSALFFSMSSLGQEGKAILNLYYHPVGPKDLVVGKTIPALIYSVLVALTVSVIVGIFFGVPILEIPVLIVVSVGVAAETSTAGVFFGLSYPDFSEGPRTRFVSTVGSLLGMLVAVITTGITLSPLIIIIFGLPGDLGFSVAAVGSFVVAIAIAFVFYKMSVSKAGSLLGTYTL
jgi:hypothetical protein